MTVASTYNSNEDNYNIESDKLKRSNYTNPVKRYGSYLELGENVEAVAAEESR